ncbi:unnamed protein product [Mesocestoides corti]|uniref:GCM domain-containing protein n=3 Tax=Mesocestoides corti TaxID=53468 RepID=A0A0R3UGW6_MESCO|nr:unnamed protein product [Mesocestoides corti]
MDLYSNLVVPQPPVFYATSRGMPYVYGGSYRHYGGSAYCSNAYRQQTPISMNPLPFPPTHNLLDTYPDNQQATVHWRTQDIPPSSTSKDLWDINDKRLPKAPRIDQFNLWPQGHCHLVYKKMSCDSVKRHASGWAMRNTNNHNKQILKKSCLGVLLCDSPGCDVALRPAICDKARKSQEGKQCTRKGCPGRISLRPCHGHGGYPVTHFWRHIGDLVFFQAKGTHDHVRPELKAIRSKPNRSKPANSASTNYPVKLEENTPKSTPVASSYSSIYPTHANQFPGVCDPSYGMAKAVVAAAAASYNNFPGGGGVGLCSPPRPPPFHSAPPPLKREDPAFNDNGFQYQISSTTTASGGCGLENGSWSNNPSPPPVNAQGEGDFPPWPPQTSRPTSEYYPNHHHPLQASSTPIRTHFLTQPSNAAFPYLPFDSSSLRSSGTGSNSNSSNDRRLS